MNTKQRVDILATWDFKLIVNVQPNGTFDMGYGPSFICRMDNYNSLEEGSKAVYVNVRQLIYDMSVTMGIDL